MTSQSIPNVEVVVDTVKGTPLLYQVKVQNNSARPMKLIWDESTYTTTGGTSYRLIRGNTRRLYTGHTQPNTPIPAGSKIDESFTAECWTDALAAGVYAYAQIESIDNYGIFRFVFDDAGQRMTWAENVKFSKPSTSP